MASKQSAPNQELSKIIQSAQRLGIELDESDALQWLILDLGKDPHQIMREKTKLAFQEKDAIISSN